MTKEEIINMARKASGEDWGIFRDFMPELERFANLVATAEREACAKMLSEEGWLMAATLVRVKK